MSLSSFNAQIRELQRRLVGYAEDVVMDATGRILVPPALRSYAQLDKAVVLVGQGHKFELWNKDHWDELMEKGGAPGAGGLPPELEGFSL
jgi:MraZ protein